MGGLETMQRLYRAVRAYNRRTLVTPACIYKDARTIIRWIIKILHDPEVPNALGTILRSITACSGHARYSVAAVGS